MMHTFFIRLAGRDIKITCNHEETKLFCKDYLIDEQKEPSVCVLVTPGDLQLERQKTDEEYGSAAGQFSDAYLETLAVYRQIAAQMPAYGILLFHGSVIAVDGEGFLFTAPSGTGKSTHTRLWRELFGERAFMVNDDKPLLKVCEDGSVIAYGTPWDGKHRLSRNTGVPLRGICILAQGKENRICKQSQAEAFPTILQQTYRPVNQPDVMKQTLDILNQIMDVGIWKLECTISEEAARLSYETMSGKEIL